MEESERGQFSTRSAKAGEGGVRKQIRTGEDEDIAFQMGTAVRVSDGEKGNTTEGGSELDGRTGTRGGGVGFTYCAWMLVVASLIVLSRASKALQCSVLH